MPACNLRPSSTAAAFAMLWAFAAGPAALAADASPLAPAATPAPVTAHWQEQKLEFGYSGFTTHYSCDGIEDKVERILLHFGARAGLKVRATGCDMGTRRVGPFAWVKADFSTLAPGEAPAGGENVEARWQTVKLSPRRPMFMDEGECELVEQLKPVLQKNFALRDLDMRTTCIAHQVGMDDYAVTAQALVPAAAPAKR
jgi:hypothetical protein